MKHILIISEAHLIRTFLLPVIRQLKKETDAVFDCFIITGINVQTRQFLSEEFDQVYSNEYPKGLLKKIPKLRILHTIYGLRRMSRSLPDYDIVHINYHHYYLAFCTSIIRKKAGNLYVTFFGSDFNQVEWFKHQCNKYSVARCDGIFTTNGLLLKQIVNKYNLLSQQISKDILFPLMESVITFKDFLRNNAREQAKKGLNVTKNLIVCGYNAAPITNHGLIIDALISSLDKISDFEIVFPMTYGIMADQTRTEIKARLKDFPLNCVILEEYLPLHQLHNLRLAADIFIHIQSRDQMSASMLEHLAAGSVVITGKWLPYDTLVEQGVYFIRIDALSDLSKTLIEVVDNFAYHKNRSENNRDIVLNMMSWENIKPNWYKYYMLESKP